MSTGEPSETQNLEQQIAALKEQLAQAQKMTALGELVSTHDARVQQRADDDHQLRQDGPAAQRCRATRQKAFDKILAAGNRAARITNSILGFARNRTDTLRTDRHEEAWSKIRCCCWRREMAKYRISIDLLLQPVPEALANANQIQQVLVNLLINARQAMQQGGRLVIKLAHDVENDMIDLMVRDSGCGMAPETLRRIFEPFYTTKSGPDASGKGGTGLGLSTCRDIIEAHHGRIRVDSTVGKGTAFTLKIPAVKKAASSVAAPLRRFCRWVCRPQRRRRLLRRRRFEVK